MVIGQASKNIFVRVDIIIFSFAANYYYNCLRDWNIIEIHNLILFLEHKCCIKQY